MGIKLDPAVFDKERQVLELRLQGYTFDLIAQEVGYASPGSAHNAYKRGLLRTLQEPSQELRDLEVARLDRLMNGVWEKAMDGDVPAVNAVLKILERRAKMLGLDAPAKIQAEVTNYEGGTDIDREVARLAEILAGQQGGGVPVHVDPSTGQA